MEVTQADEWNCVSTIHGEQCATMDGMLMMLELSADSLDCHSQVRKTDHDVIMNS